MYDCLLMGILYDVQREVDAAKAKVQQVLQLKDAYSQALSNTMSIYPTIAKVSFLAYMVLLLFKTG